MALFCLYLPRSESKVNLHSKSILIQCIPKYPPNTQNFYMQTVFSKVGGSWRGDKHLTKEWKSAIKLKNPLILTPTRHKMVVLRPTSVSLYCHFLVWENDFWKLIVKNHERQRLTATFSFTLAPSSYSSSDGPRDIYGDQHLSSDIIGTSTPGTAQTRIKILRPALTELQRFLMWGRTTTNNLWK